MEKIQVVTDGLCAICAQKETLRHLFFECRDPHDACKHLLFLLGYNRANKGWDEEKNWLIMETTKKGWRKNLLKMTAAEAIYHLWKAHNDLIFGQKTTNVDIVKSIQYTVILLAPTKKKLRDHVNMANLEIS